MNNKSIFLVIFIVSLSSIAVVLATKDYNSSKSCCPCCYGVVKLREEGVSEKDIERITDAFDDEIEAYARYNDAMANTIRTMKEVGMNEGDIDRVLSETGISGKRVALVGFGSFYIGSAEVFSKTITKVNWENIVLERAINEEGLQRIETALKDEDRAAADYNAARSNTIYEFREGGVNNAAKIAEIIDELYEPIRAADTVYDALNQAMVDFPFLGKIFGSERMNVYVGEMAPFNVVTRNGRVENLNPGETEAPTMKVYADLETIDQLIEGEITPLDALMEGKIRYEGVGLVKSIKIRVLKAASNLLHKFGIGVKEEKTEEKVSIQKTTTPPPTTQPSTTSPPTTPPTTTPRPTTPPTAPGATTSTSNCANVSVGPNLFDRGGGLIYDADRNITWLQDANYAQTSGYDSDGAMTWDDAVGWGDNLVYAGFDDWRLPTALNQDGTWCNGYCAGSELGHLYYTELGNPQDGPLSNIGPFTNLQSYYYWSGTEFNPNDAWQFDFSNGFQHAFGKSVTLYAWAVRDGDVCAPPPATTPPPTTLPPLTLPPVSESPITPIPVRPKNCIQPPSGLVSWWPGDGDANDIWDANPGTLAGDTTFAAGMVGQAFSFDGSRDYVDVGNPANLQVTGPHSAFAWVKLDSTKAEQDVVSKYAQLTSGSFTREFLLMVYNGRVRGHIGSVALSGATPLSTGTWYFIGQVWDGTTLRVYVNGAEDGSISAGAPTTGDSKFFIGARTQNGTDVRTSAVMNGLIDEVQIFNRALTPAEILAEYNAGSAGKCKEVSEVDLGIEKTVSDSNPEVGDTISYNIVVRNLNNLTVTGVVVTDILPDCVTFVSYQASTGPGTFNSGTGVWNVGTMGPFIKHNLYITVTVDSCTAGQTITNTAELTNVDQGDNNSANDQDSAVITVGTTTQPDLGIEKFQNGDFHYGQSGSYTIMVENTGNGPADSPITIKDVLPDGFTFDSFSDPYSTDWSCLVSGQVVTCTYNGPAVSPGGFLPTLIINVTIDPVDKFPGGSDAVENCATVQHPDDTNSANNESCVQTIITSL